MKAGARKVRKLLPRPRASPGFAGAAADAFTLFARFEAKLRGAPRQPAARRRGAGQGLAHRPRAAPARGAAGGGRREHSFIVSGTGDVIEPDDGLIGIGSGGPYALAAARALVAHTDLDAKAIVTEAMRIAAGDLHLHQRPASPWRSL